jgi:hypothetical protein
MLRASAIAPRSSARRKRSADELASPSFWSWDLVVDVEREATAGAVDTTKKTFQKGAASGRAYAYDHAKGAITCVGEFEASSSDRVEFGAQRGHEHTMGTFAAGVDLDAQSIRAARESLRAVP